MMLAPCGETERCRLALDRLGVSAERLKMSLITLIWAAVMLVLFGVIQPGLTGVL